MVGRGPKSCLLGHVTRLFFCLYVKHLLPSIFISVDFWSSMSCIVIDIELANKNVLKELRVFTDGKVEGYSFRPPIKYKPAKQAFWCTRRLHGIVWNSGRLDYSELSNILPRAVKAEYFSKGTNQSKNLGKLLDKEVENLEDHGSLKVQDLVVEKSWTCSRYPFRHKTTFHCAERTGKLFGNWILRHFLL